MSHCLTVRRIVKRCTYSGSSTAGATPVSCCDPTAFRRDDEVLDDWIEKLDTNSREARKKIGRNMVLHNRGIARKRRELGDAILGECNRIAGDTKDTDRYSNVCR